MPKELGILSLLVFERICSLEKSATLLHRHVLRFCSVLLEDMESDVTLSFCSVDYSVLSAGGGPADLRSLHLTFLCGHFVPGRTLPGVHSFANSKGCTQHAKWRTASYYIICVLQIPRFFLVENSLSNSLVAFKGRAHTKLLPTSMGKTSHNQACY